MAVITKEQIKKVEEKFRVHLQQREQIEEVVEYFYKQEKVGTFVLLQVLKNILNLSTKEAARILAGIRVHT